MKALVFLFMLQLTATAQIWPRLPLKDGRVLLSARLHSADEHGVWLLYPPNKAVYIKEADLPDSLKAQAMPEIRAARARVANGQPAVIPKREWDTIQTKRGLVMNNVKLMGVKETGIEVQSTGYRDVIYIDGADMPEWMVEDVIFYVRQEQHRAKAVKDAVAAGTYTGLTSKLWGNGTGRLTVKGRTLEVLELLEESPIWIKVRLSGGTATLPMTDLLPEDQNAFGYEPELAARWSTLSETQKATERAAWFERRRFKREAEAKVKGRE